MCGGVSLQIAVPHTSEIHMPPSILSSQMRLTERQLSFAGEVAEQPLEPGGGVVVAQNAV